MVGVVVDDVGAGAVVGVVVDDVAAGAVVGVVVDDAAAGAVVGVVVDDVGAGVVVDDLGAGAVFGAAGAGIGGMVTWHPASADFAVRAWLPIRCNLNRYNSYRACLAKTRSLYFTRYASNFLCLAMRCCR